MIIIINQKVSSDDYYYKNKETDCIYGFSKEGPTPD